MAAAGGAGGAWPAGLRAPPRLGNPVGTEWYVGGRWTQQIMMDDWHGGFTGHAACSSYLLYHGMRL